MTRRALVLLVLVLASGCRSASHFQCLPNAESRAPRNFGTVRTADGQPTGIYRGGQPTDCSELQFLRDQGIRSILKLNDRGLPEDAAEKEQAALLGLNVKPFAFNAATIGRPHTCDLVREAFAFLANRDNWPVYVHCTAGKDRTGYMVGLYEKLILGKTTQMVMQELNAYGHRGLRSVVMGQIDRELQRDVPACAP